MKSCSSNGDIRGLASKFDIDVPEEASYILWYIWREIHTKFSTLPACINALVEDEELYQALKVAHCEGEYDTIRQWERIPVNVQAATSKDPRIEMETRTFLAQLQPSMRKLVAGEIVLPVWSPPLDMQPPDIVEHLTSLKIPCLKEKPNLLLHDLGRFTRDPLLERRLRNVFMPNNHTFLVNTSGSGKTRLLLEGLCENWGFYFTSLVDSSLLGSSDVQNSIRTHVPDSARFRHILPPPGSNGYETALKANREIASRVFRQIFLARLMIFNLFAETMQHCISQKCASTQYIQDHREFRARWLLLQLQPRFVHPQVWDIFDELSCKLSGASDSYLNMTTKALLSNVRTLCSERQRAGCSTRAQMSTSETAQTPLFCVLDEAQHAATQHSSSFRSDQNGCHRPILREIVKAWEGQSFGQGVFMVVAGTGISKDVVDQAMASAIMKDSRYRWCSDTGAFDQMEVQKHYLQRYLPKTLLQSDSGARLLERIWYWLHGRYRFTAGYIAELLVNGFKRPHGLLNAYVQHFTTFALTDARQLVEGEGLDALPVLSLYKLDFSKLKKNSDMLSTIHQLTTHYLMRSVLPVTLGKDEATYVEYGFARFVDSETKTVAVDEPLVLLAATHWINANHHTRYKFFAKQIGLHGQSSNAFENYLAFVIDLLFSSQRRLNEVFTFCGTPPTWGNLEATLVSLHQTNLDQIEESTVRHFLFEGPSITLGTNAKSPESTLDWLAHRLQSPICFPEVAMGPDLLFVLKLSDGSLIWVALQAKFSSGNNGSLPRASLRHAMRSVTPSCFFLDKDGQKFSPQGHPTLVDDTSQRLSALPYPRADAGRYSLLRVVASFPADTKLKRCLEEDPDIDGHPIASLNMSLLKDVTRKLSPVDFLQGLEDSSKPKGKRKRVVNGAGKSQRSKRIKLN